MQEDLITRDSIAWRVDDAQTFGLRNKIDGIWITHTMPKFELQDRLGLFCISRTSLWTDQSMYYSLSHGLASSQYEMNTKITGRSFNHVPREETDTSIRKDYAHWYITYKT